MTKISRSQRKPRLKEQCFVWGTIAFVLVVTSLPYLYGYLSSPPNKQFMGLMLDVPDHGQYLSWFREFQRAFLISNKLTPEPNEAVFFNLLWWTLAQIARFTGAGYAIIYQGFRWIAGALVMWTTYRFIVRFVDKVWWQRVTFLLITFSSGLGWVLIVLKYTVTKGELLYPLDVYIVEGNTFLGILAYPHFFAMAFIIGAFILLWRGYQKQEWHHPVLAGLVALILGWQHAYDLIILYSVWGGFTLLVWLRERHFQKYLFWSGVVLVLISCWPALYSVYITSAYPVWREVLAQFANAGVYTPNPFHLLILFGLPLIITTVTWTGIIPLHKLNDRSLFIHTWFGVGFLLNYIPTDFQIHMLNSWQIPMMILTVESIYQHIGPAASRWFTNRWSRDQVSRSLGILLLLAVLPTNLYLWAWRFVDLARHDYPYYLYKDEIAAMEWLEENTEIEDIVLSSLTTGQYIPVLSGNTAFLAHWAQTVDFYDKRKRVNSFFDPATAEGERIKTLDIFGVDYVLHGPAERKLGDYDPATAPWLTLTFSTAHVDVYRVQSDKLSAPIVSGDDLQ